MNELLVFMPIMITLLAIPIGFYFSFKLSGFILVALVGKPRLKAASGLQGVQFAKRVWWLFQNKLAEFVQLYAMVITLLYVTYPIALQNGLPDDPRVPLILVFHTTSVAFLFWLTAGFIFECLDVLMMRLIKGAKLTWRKK